MPHIVFDKKINLEDFSKKFIPIFQNNQILIKIFNIYVDKNNQTALLPSLVIEEFQQSYFIEMSTTNSKTTIRLYPHTDPVKTEGVKHSIVLLAKQIIDVYNVSITKTNLNVILLGGEIDG